MRGGMEMGMERKGGGDKEGVVGGLCMVVEREGLCVGDKEVLSLLGIDKEEELDGACCRCWLGARRS